VLDELARNTRENTLLVVREDLHAVCIAMHESPQPLRLFAQVGRHVPLHAGGGPKVLLAFAPEEVRRAVLDRPLEGFTSTSITDRNKLARTLTEIRQAGFTLSIGELDPDVFSMAAPVRDFTGDVVAALSVAGPLSRLTAAERRRFRKLILDAAEQLSAELGLAPTTALTA
jgi:IclR family KDG regulon transcriptional repressor